MTGPRDYPFTIEVTVPLRTDLGQQLGATQHVPCIAEHRLEFSQVDDVTISDEEANVTGLVECHLHLNAFWWGQRHAEPELHTRDLCAVFNYESSLWESLVSDGDVTTGFEPEVEGLAVGVDGASVQDDACLRSTA